MRQRSAELIARGDSYFVTPYSRTVDWLWIADQPIVKLPISTSIPDVAAAVTNALARSRWDIERPLDLSRAVDPLLRLAKVRSQRAFYGGARIVHIDEENGTIRVNPAVPVGPATRRYPEYQHPKDRQLVLENPTKADLAEAIGRALELAE
jgi:hypothetical protein